MFLVRFLLVQLVSTCVPQKPNLRVARYYCVSEKHANKKLQQPGRGFVRGRGRKGRLTEPSPVLTARAVGITMKGGVW